MKKPVFKLLATLVVLAGMAAWGSLHAMFTPGATGAHLQTSNCASCHLAGKDVTAQTAGVLTASQEVLCAKCHPTAIQVSHPSGFQPKTTPPAAYPLDWKGDLTCSSCHDIHSSTPGLLRGAKVGKALCFDCHAADFFSAMRDGGTSLMAGHLVNKGIDSNAPTLDAYSNTCMECHGQSATPRLATSIDRNGVVRHASQSANHPIGMRYEDAASFGGYRTRASVERKLMLPEGKMGCVSCHSGYQKEHGKLIVATAKSALCYECHDL
jgi:predicted CXXCH cytochrome family protein